MPFTYDDRNDVVWGSSDTPTLRTLVATVGPFEIALTKEIDNKFWIVSVRKSGDDGFSWTTRAHDEVEAKSTAYQYLEKGVT